MVQWIVDAILFFSLWSTHDCNRVPIWSEITDLVDEIRCRKIKVIALAQGYWVINIFSEKEVVWHEPLYVRLARSSYQTNSIIFPVGLVWSSVDAMFILRSTKFFFVEVYYDTLLSISALILWKHKHTLSFDTMTQCVFLAT